MREDVYLITGGSGFIGSYLANYLYFLKLGKIYIIDKVKPPNFINQKIIYEELDIIDLKKLSKYLKIIRPNYIFHLAARTDLAGENINAYSSNTIGTKNLIKATKNCNFIKRIIFTSSMLVCKIGHQPSNDYDYCPTTFYGKSKVIGEKLVKNNSYNYSWCIVRPTSIWGPGFKIPYKNFFNLVLENKYFHIGQNKSFKTYGYIGNTVHQLIALMHQKEKNIHKKTFYLGDSSKYNLRSWANEISELSNSKKIKELPLFLVYFISLFGSLLKRFKLNPPLTLFRFKNMTSNNIINLEPIIKISENLPFDRKTGVLLTLDWLLNEKTKYNSYGGFKKLFKSKIKS